MVRQTFEIVRTTAAAAKFALGLGIGGARGADGFNDVFHAVTLLRTDETGKVEAATGLGAQIFAETDYPRAWVGEQTIDTCSSASVCEVTRTVLAISVTYADDSGGPDVDNRFLVTLQYPAGVEISYDFDATGWELRQPDSWNWRFLSARETSEAGAQIGDLPVVAGVDYFSHATLPGSAFGSVTQAIPPCSGSQGAGRIDLTGGRSAVQGVCPGIGSLFLTSVADGATEWIASGNAVGANSPYNVRLFVLDLPEPEQIKRAY